MGTTTTTLALLSFTVSLLIFSSAVVHAVEPLHPIPLFNRSSFPPDFLFGAASSAYQSEGAAFKDGKGPSVWDTYVHQRPERILDGTNGDIANDFYHRYKEDVKLFKDIGLDAYRLSISWPRILPRGKLSGGVNKAGIAFYKNVLDEIIAHGITPFVTLFHWDTPQALEDEYGGFLSPHIVDDFKDFADVCFKEFGDRVKFWITLNEPISYANAGYDGGLVGNFAPGRCSDRTICPQGNSSTEPYIVGHNLLRSHAAAVKLYRKKYQVAQKGEIGITLVTHWFVPYSNSRLDVQAARRALNFMFGWFIHPVVYGDYPPIMRTLVGSRLPKFTIEESVLLKGSYDFIGLNYYTGFYVANILNGVLNSSTADLKARLISERNGVSIGNPTGVGSFHVYPQGFRELLVYTKENYKNPKIYITENGIGDQNNVTSEESIRDPQRIAFYQGHLQAAIRAISENKVNLKGFIAWSFLDNYEWNSGFTLRFGLCYVDWKSGSLKRTPKQSAMWFKNFLSVK